MKGMSLTVKTNMENCVPNRKRHLKIGRNKKVSNNVLVYSGNNYEVVKFQVNEKATYTIYTSLYIEPKTTVLALVDYNFKHISNISNTNSVITKTLDNSDYYILIRLKIESSNINCLLYIRLGN